MLAVATVAAGIAAAAQRRPNFANDVAPIFYDRCVGCHRPDRAETFSLLSSDDAAPHGKEIRAAVLAKTMPPWSAAAASGFPALQQDQRLTARQISTITAWVDGGMPRGDLAKTPQPPSFPASWTLGLPDLTISLPHSIPLPPDTIDRVFNVLLPLNYQADRWLTGFDYEPSSTGVLTHAILFAVPASMTVDEQDVLPGFGGLMGTASPPPNIGEQLTAVDRSIETIGVWTPSGRVWPAPEGTALRLPKNTNLVMQFHARAPQTGAIEDGTLALYFAKTRPAVSLSSLQLPASLGIAAGIDLPAGQSRIVVRDELTLPADVVAYGARGHGHLLARDMRIVARLPNGSVRGLLWIDRWDVRWQETYYFTAPVKLPTGTTLQVELTYDNSGDKPHRVVWGPRLSDEVGAMDLVIATPEGGDAAALASARAAHFREQLLKGGGR